MSKDELARELEALISGGAPELSHIGLWVTRNASAILAALRSTESAGPVDVADRVLLEKAVKLLRGQLPDLKAAAIPTKEETYVKCGTTAAALHVAIETVLTALAAMPTPIAESETPPDVTQAGLSVAEVTQGASDGDDR